jgi:hypothetical protein
MEIKSMIKLALKWDFKTKEYNDYVLPDNAVLFTEDMDEIIPCSSCKKEVAYGKTYTSKTIHNKIGLGFPVCEECYKKELSDAKG